MKKMFTFILTVMLAVTSMAFTVNAEEKTEYEKMTISQVVALMKEAEAPVFYSFGLWNGESYDPFCIEYKDGHTDLFHSSVSVRYARLHPDVRGFIDGNGEVINL